MGGITTKKCKKQQHLRLYSQNTYLQIQQYPISQYIKQPAPLYFKRKTTSPISSPIKIEILENQINTSPKNIIKKIKNLQTAKDTARNIQDWKNQIAPSSEIIKDIEHTLAKTSLMFLSPEMSTILNIKTIEGHAQNGHATFQNIYSNTTTMDVLKTIENEGSNQLRKKFSIKNFKDITQSYNDATVTYIEEWFKDKEQNISKIETLSNTTKFRNSKLKTLNKMSCLKGMEIEPLELARGFYLTTNMDNLKEIREEGFKKYSHQLGGGECYLTLTKKLQKYGIGIDNLSGINYKGILEILNDVSHGTKLEVLEDLGIITRKTLPLEDIAQGEFTWDKIKSHPSTTDLLKNPEYSGQYIREIKGRGVGDDIVIFLAGFLPPTIYNDGHKESKVAIQSRIIGGLSGDQMDTMEKDSKLFIPGGQDKIAGLHINGLFRKLAKDKRFRKRYNIKEKPDGDYNLVEHDELVDFTMAGANTEKETIHSSQKWFYKEIQKTCAISEYMKYTYFIARVENREMYLSDIRNFKIDLEKNPATTKFTFRGIPLQEIQRTMKERLNLVIDPAKREERLKQYYCSN